MFLSYCPVYALQVGIRKRLFIVHLLNDYEPLFTRFVYGKCRPTSRLQRRVTPVDRVLDVLRVMILPSYYDEVFAPCGDKEFSFLREAEIACAQKRAFSGIHYVRVENL